MALLSTPLDTFTSTPPVTKAFTISLLVASLGFQYASYTSTTGKPPYLEWLLLYPGWWIYNPWTIVTCVLVEPSVFGLIGGLVFTVPSLRYFERLWGTVETIKFIVIVAVVSNAISLVVNYLESFIFGYPEIFLYGMAYYGTTALQAGFLVAFTQIIPEHQVQLFGFVKARVKRLPMAYVGLSNVMCVLGMQSPWILIQWGWLVSWGYLRFWKKTSADGATLNGTIGAETWGDRSETFAFVHWFPPLVHGPLGKVCDFVYDNAVKLKIVRGHPSADSEGGYMPLSAGGGAGNSRAEAERRRAMALKALDQRMANTAGSNTASGSRPPQPANGEQPAPTHKRSN
ncbi:hypothetical protein FRB90_000553, partial [Tulasnella sp. 427]